MLDGIVEDVELVEDLESFDSRITERGWTFDDDQSDEEFVIWFYPPSGAEVGEGRRTGDDDLDARGGERRVRPPHPGRDGNR